MREMGRLNVLVCAGVRGNGRESGAGESRQEGF